MKHYYFAYGSNMDAAQMVRRCPSSQFIGTGWLRDYQFDYPLQSSSRAGMGVAGVLPFKGNSVWGVVWEMTMEDILILDGFENTPHHYQRIYCSIEMINHTETQVECAVYEPVLQAGGPFPPSDEYAAIILRGATAFQAPTEYIDLLHQRSKPSS